MSEDQIVLNGIDGVTGEYLVPPLSRQSVVNLIRPPADREEASWLKRIRSLFSRPFLGLPVDIDPTDVSRAGWGVVVSSQSGSDVISALEPLLAQRRSRVVADRFKILDYQSGETMKDWLKRHGVYPGSVAPTRVPYYLLLVGEPESIPFDFQYSLDIEYAVGRLCFDHVDQYRLYAESLVEYENAQAAPTSRQIVYWGTKHLRDRATEMSADFLISPLHDGVPAAADQSEESAIAQTLGFHSLCLKGPEATKGRLTEILNPPPGAGRPSFLFTASHGMGWPKGHQRQRSAQGALLCQDWSGFGSIRPHEFLAAADIGEEAHVHGLVAFLFACFGAGTPAFDNFLSKRSERPVPLADTAFVASLPQRLLSHPQGSALAVLGHVDRAWGYSIRPPGVGPQLVPFRNCIGRILSGQPVGHSTKDFSEKYAVLSGHLLQKLDQTQGGASTGDDELAQSWVERNDAQNYVLLGDPAVRLAVNKLQKRT
jgi:hypothetical protein